MKKTEKQLINEMQMMLEFVTSELLDENGESTECPRLHGDLTEVHTLLNEMTGFNESVEDTDWISQELANLKTLLVEGEISATNFRMLVKKLKNMR